MGQIGWEQVELHAAFGGRLLGELLAAGVPRLPGGGLEVVEGGSLHVDDLAELAGDVVVDASEVVAFELLPPPAPHLVEQVAQTLARARRRGHGTLAAAAGAGRR